MSSEGAASLLREHLAHPPSMPSVGVPVCEDKGEGSIVKEGVLEGEWPSNAPERNIFKKTFGKVSSWKYYRKRAV